MSRQYLACVFKPDASARYSYHNDHDPVEVGDRVIVSGKFGPATVIVLEILEEAPPFETKPIVGKEYIPNDLAVNGAHAA